MMSVVIYRERMPSKEDIIAKVKRVKELFKDLASSEKEAVEIAYTFVHSFMPPDEWEKGKKLRVDRDFLEKLYDLFAECFNRQDVSAFYDYVLGLPDEYVNIRNVNVFEYDDPLNTGVIGIELLLWRRRGKVYELTSKIIVIDLYDESIYVYNLTRILTKRLQQ